MNTNKKQMLKRICAAVLAVITVAGTLPEGLGTVHAATYKTYEKPYTIANVLTDYSYFVSGNVVGDSSSHTVGAVAVGGVLSIANNIGNAQLAPSYINTIDMSAMTDFPQSNWIPTGSKDLYYKTLSGDPYNSKSWMVQRFTYNPDYIDFDTAFKSLQTESKNLAKSATAVSASEGTLTIDFTSTKSVSVSASDLNDASSVVIQGLTLEKIKSNRYVINVTGKDAVKFSCNSVTIADENKPLGNLLKSMKDATEGGQLNTTGMKLIWNFPEAASVTATSLGGHLVAPNADVRLDGGNFEGNIIAKSVSASAEGHFFSYGNGGDEEPEEPTTPDPGEETKTATIKLIKTGGFGALVGAKFTLYKDKDCKTAYTSNIEGASYENVKSEISYDPSESSTYLKAVVSFIIKAPSEETTYFLKEVTAPTGYELNTTVYQCKVTTAGKVQYSTDGKNWSDDFPTCENTLKTINLIKMDPDGNKLTGAEFTLHKVNDDSFTAIKATATKITNTSDALNGYAVVRFTGSNDSKFTAGTYYFEETKTPSGYTVSSEDGTATRYYAKVDDNGNVTYLDGGEGGKYSAKFPTCTNNTVSLSITKTDADGDSLPGALIGLYAEINFTTNNLKYEVMTDQNGKATFTQGEKDYNGKTINLDNKTYYLKETVAPVGYKISDTYVKAVIDDLGKVTYTIGNDTEATTDPVIVDDKNDTSEEPIQLKKVDDSSRALSGAKFGLYSDKDCKVLVATGITGEDGSVKFEQLSSDNVRILFKNSTYYLKEITAPTGYALADDVIECKIDSDGKVTYKTSSVDNYGDTVPTVTDKKLAAVNSIELTKKSSSSSENNKALSGAVFGLYTVVKADTSSKKLVVNGLMATATSGDDGKVSFSNSITGTNGQALQLYANATYYIQEISAPTGYNINETVYKIEAGSNGNLKWYTCKYDSNDTSDYIAETEITNASSGVTCQDDPLSAANSEFIFTLKKMKEVTSGQTTNLVALGGATFTIYSDEGCTTSVDTATSDNNGTVTFTAATGDNVKIKVPSENDQSVVYYIKETTAPAGFTPSSEIYNVKITKQNNTEKPYKVEYKLNSQGELGYTTEPLTCVNDPYSIMIKKTGSGNEALTGAEFGLFKTKSDAINAIKSGSRSVALATNKTAMVTSYAAAVFESGKDSLTLESGKDYYLAEIKAPAGYEASTAVYKATIQTDGTVKYANVTDGERALSDVPVVSNLRIGGDGDTLSLIKVDTNGAAVAGAEFTLYEDKTLTSVKMKAKSVLQNSGAFDGKAVVSFISSDENKLERNKIYYMKETAAPSGYGVSDTVFACRINSSDGQVYYRIVSPADKATSYSTEFPVCENTIVPSTPGSNDPGDPGSSSPSDPGDPDTPGTSVTPKPSPKTPGTVTITYEDDPVENGTVVVENEDGEEITVTTGENGEFYIEPGTYKIISINGTKVPDGYAVTVDEGGTASVAVLGRRRSPKTGQLPIVPMAAGTVVIIGAAIYVLDRKRRESK